MKTRLRVVGRAAFYLVALAVAIGVLIFGAHRTIGNSMVSCMDEPAERAGSAKAPGNLLNLLDCLERRNNALANLALYPMSHRLRELPNAPAGYTGHWISRQPDCAYCLETRRDGRFAAHPLHCPRRGERFSGAWGVVGEEMIWMYDQGRIWPPAINPIEQIEAHAFVLREENGTRTRFHRPDAREAATCWPPTLPEAPPEVAATGEASSGAVAPAGDQGEAAAPMEIPGVKVVAPAGKPLEELDDVLTAASWVATREAAVDALVRWCVDQAPQSATLARLSREVWRTRQQRVLGLKTDVLRGISRREFVAGVEAAARRAGEERVEALARPGAPSPAIWCQGIEDTLAAPEYDLKADEALLRRLAAGL